MSYVVVAGGMIQCSHKGTYKLASGDSRLTIAGQTVLVSGMEAGLSFAPGAPGVEAPCSFSTAAGPSPCTATMAAIGGVSTQLTIGGMGAILDSATGQATNANDPSATWSVADAGQSLVTVDQ